MAAHPTKKVAFLSFDWDFEIVSEYYYGIQHALAARDDIQVVIFNAFGHHQENYEPEPGAHLVFTLCDLERFDGFLIQGNRTWAPGLRQAYVDRAVALGKPVVSINYELEGAHSVGTDNYQAMYELVSKVLSDTGRKRPAFVNGLATSVEAQARAQGFRDACAAQGFDDPRFYQANWQIEEGRATAERMLAEDRELSDLVFCCNDDLAVGLMETLQEHGVRVPDDLMVTGFDNREISRCTVPRITTIDRDYFTIAQTALAALERLMAGKRQPSWTYSPCRFILRESCGYVSADQIDEMKDLYSIDNSLKRFYEVLSNFQTAVFNTASLYEIFDICEDFAAEIGLPNIFLSTNDRYLNFEDDKPVDAYAPVSHLMAHRGPAVERPRDNRHIYASYLTETLLPPEVAMDAPVYMVLPLRHGATCIGMVITEGVSRLSRHGFLAFCLTMLAGSLESARRNEMLKTANSRLDSLYVHDELTGLFNRFGLDRFGEIAYRHLLRDFEEAWFIFVDIDDMKTINDVHGHEMGDQALRDTADIIRRATIGQNAFYMRYGGDEFLIISRRDLTDHIERELAMIMSSSRRAYDLALSVGATRIEAKDHLDVKAAITAADSAMYRVKKEHKVER